MDQWIRDIPPVTRTYLFGAFVTTAACSLELLSPFQLYFSIERVFEQHQLWRIITNFLFFEQEFNLDFFFRMFFLVRYCRTLEEGSFRGRTADFFYMILFGSIIMLLVAPILGMHFLGSSLTFMMVYLWGRRHPYSQLNFLGVFTFTAPYLPWVLLGFSILLGHNGLTDIVGIVVGHMYYFLEDVYPKMIPSRARLLKTPRILELLFQADDDDDGDDDNDGDNGDGIDDLNFEMQHEHNE
jgi:Derlin-2/3